MYWEEDSILNKITEYTSPYEIFQEVCNTLGRYYENNGFKYSKSRPKISSKQRDIKIEVSFWSSRSNTPGSYVNLEILPHFYSIAVKKMKEKQDIKNNGLLMGHVQLLTEKYPDAAPGRVKVKQIFEADIERFEEDREEAVIKKNHNCNIYNINEIKFKKIIDFIDEQINFVETLYDYKKLKEFLLSKPANLKKYFDGNFKEFIILNYKDEAEGLLELLT